MASTFLPDPECPSVLLVCPFRSRRIVPTMVNFFSSAQSAKVTEVKYLPMEILQPSIQLCHIKLSNQILGIFVCISMELLGLPGIGKGGICVRRC